MRPTYTHHLFIDDKRGQPQNLIMQNLGEVVELEDVIGDARREVRASYFNLLMQEIAARTT